MTSVARPSSTKEVLSVAIEIANARHLWKLDQNYSLFEIIQELCLTFKLPYQDEQYALQLNIDEFGNNKYISETNLSEVKNGSILKLVYSPSEMAKMIIHKIKNDGEWKGLGEEAIWALEKLQGLASDVSFAKEFHAKGGVSLLYVGILEFPLHATQLAFCLTTVDHMMKHRLITVLDDAVIERIVEFIVSEKISGLNIIAPSLSILAHLIGNGGNEFIDKTVELPQLIPHLWNQDNQLVQANVLAVMNAMARSKNKKVFTSMASKHMKDNISKNILSNDIHPDSDIAKELFEYQMLILSFKEKKFNTPIKYTDKDLPKLRELSRGVDVAEPRTRHSVGSLLNDDNALPESYVTKSSSMQEIPLPVKKNKSTSQSGTRANSSLGHSSIVEHTGNLPHASTTLGLSDFEGTKLISCLTLDCMTYFKRNYPKEYFRMLLAEAFSGQTFPVTCECLVKLIADVLGISKNKVNVKKYQPLMFREPAFIEELFCRMFLQLGRTRQDMKARTMADQEKVIWVLQRQLTEVLTKQPGSLKDLTRELRTFNYATISELWLREMMAKENKVTQSPAIMELKERCKGEILALIRQQRIQVLLKGAEFPKSGLRGQKLKKRTTFVILSSNQKSFHYHDCDEDGRTIPETSGKISLAEISTLVVGKKCPHMIKEARTNNKVEYELAFSLIPDLEPGSSFDFTAPDQLTFDYWTDAINIILGKEMKSKTMEVDLEKLLDMDVKLQLLELTGVKIPKQPPPVPPEPDNYYFHELYTSTPV